jgi:hypothetical protein
VRRKPLAIGLVVLLVLGLLAAWRAVRGPEPGRVHVYDAKTGHKLWSATTEGGYVVLLAVTAREVLVADADDCVGGGSGRIEILSSHGARVVRNVTGCAAYRADRTMRGLGRQVVGRRLVLQLPTEVGGGHVSLACPCGGASGLVVLGSFTPGSD